MVDQVEIIEKLEKFHANNFIENEAIIDYSATWKAVLAILAKKLRKPSFDTWIRPTLLIEIKNETAAIAVRNEFTRNFLLQSYYKDIQDAIKEVLAQSLAIKFIIVDNLETEVFFEEESLNENTNSIQISFAEISSPKASLKKINNKLNPKFSLSNFIIGKSNHASFIFAKAILESNSGIYDSLFIYSETGLGKTHLLNAIGNYSLELDPSIRTKYVKAEEFTNELIIAIQRNNTAQFRNNYRNLDLLLFDDFQFLDNKKTCQEEFSHTIESIIEAGGKIIICSAKSIDEFKNLSNKLKSKIKGSLSSCIERPSFSTRVQILSEKANFNNIKLEEKHLGFIANRFDNNIRELEGALVKVSAMQNFAGEDIDDELIANLFGGLAPEPEYKGLSLEKITKTVAEYFSLNPKDLFGKSRVKELSEARHIAMYLTHNLLRLSYSRIGESFSGRKHSSVIHSISLIRKEMNSDKHNSRIKIAVNSIKGLL